MPKRFLLPALAVTLPVVASFSQTAELSAPKLSPAAAAIVAENSKPGHVMDHLDYLTNSIGPRLTGSENLVLACRWAAGVFKGFGLQNVHLEEWGEVPVSFNRGPWFGAMMWSADGQSHRELLEFNTPAWSAGTKGLHRAKAFLLPKTEAEFAKIKSQLEGAWVVQTGSSRGRRGPRGGAARRGARGAQGGQGAQEDTAPRFNALRACEQAGIAGVIRNSGSEYLRTSSNRRVNWRQVSMDNLPKQAQITLVKEQFEQLAGLLAKKIGVELEFHIQNRFRPGPVKLYNVVADIPGTEKPNEYVLVGGHIDCWDGANGAIDNGSGCTTAIEAARLIMAAGVKPRRTIRFVIWSGEEQGLLGSRAYVQKHKDELARISCYLNHDSGTNYVSGITCTKAMKAAMEKAFAGVSEITPGMPFALREVAGLRGGGSDHSSFLSAGVPAWSWQLTGKHNYRHIWHTQFDNYEQAVPSYQQHSAMVIAIGAVNIANLDELLSREKMSAPGGGRRRFNPGIQVEGLKVTGIDAQSPFATAGFKKGDTILRVGETKVESLRDVYRAVFRAGGEAVQVTVLRAGKEVELKFKLNMRRRRGG